MPDLQKHRIVIRSELIKAAAHFPLLPCRVARRQAKRLLRARAYLERRGILACALGSQFQYCRATGSVLK